MTDLTHVQQMWASDEASRRLGIVLQDVGVNDEGLGFARTCMTITEPMVNGHGITHGGFVFTLADSTFALTCNASGQLTVAAGADIDFVSATRLGDVLVAEGRERARYGRSGITDVTVTREPDLSMVAEFRGRSRALPPRKDA